MKPSFLYYESFIKCSLSSSCPCDKCFFTISIASPVSPHNPITPLIKTSFLFKSSYALDIDLETVFQGNIDKLKNRYPEGFDIERSKNRAEGDI